jgi:hypothetical protein
VPLLFSSPLLIGEAIRFAVQSGEEAQESAKQCKAWGSFGQRSSLASPNQIKLLPTPRSGAKRSQRSQIKPLHEAEGEAKGQSQRAKSKGEAIHPQSGEAEKQFDLAKPSASR